MILPRVGWEVSVGYLEGDPDRPFVLQKLYNRETMPPYEQPSNNTQTALQSVTSPGGGGTNEIRLQDGNGAMEFFVHASRDLM
jgi:type VI secretion system secreted protein VgrG